MENRESFEMIVKIAIRAENMNLLMFNRMTLIMDLDNAHEQFNLRLDDLLKADDANFVHDIVGIQNNFNRQSLKMENCFVPRFTSRT